MQGLQKLPPLSDTKNLCSILASTAACSLHKGLTLLSCTDRQNPLIIKINSWAVSYGYMVKIDL